MEYLIKDEEIIEFYKKVKKKTLKNCYHIPEENSLRYLKKFFKDMIDEQQAVEFQKRIGLDIDNTAEKFAEELREKILKKEAFEAVLKETLEKCLTTIIEGSKNLKDKELKEYREICDKINAYIKDTFVELMIYKAFTSVLKPLEGESSEEFYSLMYSILKRVEKIDEEIIKPFSLKSELSELIELFHSIKVFDLFSDKPDFELIYEEKIQYEKAKEYFSKTAKKRKEELLKELSFKRADELDIIVGSEMLKGYLKGYCLYALEEAGVEGAKIDFDALFEKVSASKAREKAE